MRLSVLTLVTGALVLSLFTGAIFTESFNLYAQSQAFPNNVFASSSQGRLHELVLKATEENGQTSMVPGFTIDLTNVISVPSNSELSVFTTDSSLSIVEAKVKTTTDTFIDLVKNGANSFSLSGLLPGVYTLDVISQKGTGKAAYEGILVLSQDSTNLQTQTIINQQITKEEGNGGSGSNDKLDISIAVGRNPIVRGNIQTISSTVTDSQSGNGISGAKIDGQVRYVTGHVERFSGNTDGDGKYKHQWRISGNANPGVFQVKADASSSGHGSGSDSASFRVIGASEAELSLLPDPCLDNPTLPECVDPCLDNPTLPECVDPCLDNPTLPECVDPCEVNPDAEECQPDPCEVNPDAEECQEDDGDDNNGDSAGNEGSGDEGSGDEGSGDEGSGDEGSGDEGSGDEGSGDEGSGDEGSGDEGSGDEEEGGN